MMIVWTTIKPSTTRKCLLPISYSFPPQGKIHINGRHAIDVARASPASFTRVAVELS